MQFISCWVHGSLSSRAEWMPGPHPSSAVWTAVPESASVTVSGGMDDWHVIFDKCLCQRALHAVGTYRHQNSQTQAAAPQTSEHREGLRCYGWRGRKRDNRGQGIDWETWALPLFMKLWGNRFLSLCLGFPAHQVGKNIPALSSAVLQGPVINFTTQIAMLRANPYRAHALGQAFCACRH